MTPARCPACGAAVNAGAPWCTLCYADLRVPAAAPEPVAAPAIAEYAPSMAAGAQLTGSPLPPDPILDRPSLDAPVMAAPPVARTPADGWPCARCGARVPLADDACGSCGAPFLPSEEMPSLALPGVGDLTRLDRGQRIGVTVVIGLVVTGLLVALAFLAGSIV